MSTHQETKYKVQSLERGLSILRELRAANAPVRNQDLVERTRLPKATVSRLLNTLGTLGYVRRIDQGSYVLAHASGRSGRALIASLGLQRYRHLFADAPGPVYLEALTLGRMTPVYRWCGADAAPVAHGHPRMFPPEQRGDRGEWWDAGTGTCCVWQALPLPGIGSFALNATMEARVEPTPDHMGGVRRLLEAAAQAIIGDFPS